MFTTGYGDITAVNIYEQWICSIGILIGSCFFAYFIGVLTNGLGDDLRHDTTRTRLEQSLAFCAHYDLPRELRRAVLTHMRYWNSYNYLFDCQETMDALPNYLQKQIERYLAAKVLKELDIFEALDKDIIGQIALRLKSKSVGAEQWLYKSGEIGKEMYIQRTGRSKLVSKQNNGEPNRYRMLKRGDVVGENAILSRTRTDTVICLEWSEFYVLDVNDITKVLKDNYDMVTARKHWVNIKKTITKSITDSNYFKASAEISADYPWDKPYHRHVRFKTLDMQDYETFVDPRMCDGEPSMHKSFINSDNNNKNKTYSEYEHDLEVEEETESKRIKQKKNKRRTTFKSLQKLFPARQTSHSRNDLQRQHYRKLKKSRGNVPYDGERKSNERVDVNIDMDVNGEIEDNIAFYDEMDGDDEYNIFANTIEPPGSAGYFSSRSNDIFSAEHTASPQQFRDNESKDKEEEDGKVELEITEIPTERTIRKDDVETKKDNERDKNLDDNDEDELVNETRETLKRESKLQKSKTDISSDGNLNICSGSVVSDDEVAS